MIRGPTILFKRVTGSWRIELRCFFDTASFNDLVKIVRGNVSQVLDQATGPFDLQVFNYGFITKPEVQPLIVGGKIAAASPHFINLNKRTCGHFDTSSDRRAVTLLPY